MAVEHIVGRYVDDFYSELVGEARQVCDAVDVDGGTFQLFFLRAVHGCVGRAIYYVCEVAVA